MFDVVGRQLAATDAIRCASLPFHQGHVILFEADDLLFRAYSEGLLIASCVGRGFRKTLYLFGCIFFGFLARDCLRRRLSSRL